MGTITFEKTTTKITKFFAATAILTSTNTSTELLAGVATSIQMYTDEPQVALNTCTYRSYELYIDDDATMIGDPEANAANGAYRMARVTYDASKTASDGYDVYIDKTTLPASGDALTSFTVDINKLAETLDIDGDGDLEAPYFRIVVVAEKVA